MFDEDDDQLTGQALFRRNVSDVAEWCAWRSYRIPLDLGQLPAPLREYSQSVLREVARSHHDRPRGEQFRPPTGEPRTYKKHLTGYAERPDLAFACVAWASEREAGVSQLCALARRSKHDYYRLTKLERVSDAVAASFVHALKRASLPPEVHEIAGGVTEVGAALEVSLSGLDGVMPELDPE